MISLTKRAEIQRIAEIQIAGGAGFRVPLYRAAAAGIIQLCEVPHGSALVPKKVLEHHARPLVIVIGDDDLGSPGPTGWPQARRLFRWARAAVVHGAAGKPEHYAAAVVIAGLAGRVLFVETNTQHAPAWLDMARAALPPPAILAILTPPGAPPHPAWRVPEGVTVQ